MKKIRHLNTSELAASRTFLTGIIFRLISIIVSFVSVPLLLNYLGNEIFGVLNTLLVLFFYLNRADLGIGFSLQTEYPNLKKDEKTLRNAYTSALILNIFVAVLLFAVSVIFSYSAFFVHKFSALNTNSTQILGLSSWRTVFLLIVGIIAIELPLDIGVRCIVATHKKYITNTALAISGVFSLVLTMYFINARWSISWLVFAQFGMSTLAFLFVFFAAFQIPELKTLKKIRLSDFSFAFLKTFLPAGLRYNGIQLLTVLMFWSDNIFIAHALGFEEVTKYALASKVGTLLTMPAVVFSSAVFSMFNEAVIRNDKTALQKMSRQNLLLISFYVLAAIVFIYVGVNFFTKLWLQKNGFWNAEWKFIMSLQIVFYCFYIYCIELLMSAPLIKRGTRLFVPIMLIAFTAKFIGLYFGGILGLVVLPTIILTVGYILPALKILFFPK